MTQESKRKITRASAKDKARRLQQWVAKKISEVTGIPWGKDELIESREMGQSGVDVKLYGDAKEKFPFGIECRYRETWNIPGWIRDAKEYKKPEDGFTDWLLFVKKNHHEEIVIMDGVVFFDLIDRYLHLLYGKEHKIL